jgi:hypothetical protein
MRSHLTAAQSRRRRRSIGTVVAAGALALSLAGAAQAKEITSGGGTGGGSAACNPVTALKYRGDATTSDTALATIDVSYAVKSCNANPVTASIVMFESADPSVVVYADPAAPLSGKFTVAGVKRNFSYQVKITVTDQVTGTVQGTRTIFAAAVYKGI